MMVFFSLIILILTLGAGFCLQNLVRWSPWLNVVFSFLEVIILPPIWSWGLIIGTWLSCAFFTYQPEGERRMDTPQRLNWGKVLLCSGWVFSGFLLTMLLLWRIKTGELGLSIAQRELLGWVFLSGVEICLFKVIARNTPPSYRIPLGYGIAAINFVLLCFWLYSVSILEKMMILFVLMAVSPWLLLYLDHSPAREY